MTDTQKTPRQQLEELVEAEKMLELQEIARVVRNDVGNRFIVKVSSRMVWLYTSDNGLVTLVTSLQNWDGLKKFAHIMNTPSDSEMEAMNVDFQEEKLLGHGK